MPNRGHSGPIISHTRTNLYHAARGLGDLQALSSGDPHKIAMRVVRRAVGRSVAKTMWHYLR